jgi:hypothetical protein
MLKEILKKSTRASTGQLFIKTVGLFECDDCFKSYEAKYVPRLAEKLTFCSRSCMNQSARNGKILEKKRETAISKYGTTHHEKSEVYKEKKKEANLQKWGVDHHWKLEEIKEKRVSTWQKNYGVSNPFEAEAIKEKIKIVCVDRHGSENPFSSEEIKLKIKKTCLERYGVEHVSRSQEIHKKQLEAQVGMNYDFYYNVFLEKFEAYKRQVWAETRKQPIENLENFDKRERTGYHLDHIYSIRQGFIDDVKPEIIGSICNLRMITSKENISKYTKCDISLEELLEVYEKRKEQK